jgi:transposase-like protein
MSHHEPDATTITAALELLTKHGFEDLANALEILLNEAMRLERSEYLGAAPWERTDGRRGYANGFKPKRVRTRLGDLDLEIPKTRGHEEGAEPFYPQSLERGVRSEQALRLALAEMYVQGVSTRKVRAITEQLCGTQISSSQVSRVSAQLDEQLEQWRTRRIGRVRYLVLDATYLKVRHGGSVVDCAVLIAAGVREDGKRSILGCSVSLSEAEVHWRTFLEGLVERGLHGIEQITSDDHAGLRAAIRAVLPSTPWQRCQVHLQRNAVAYVPKVEMRAAVARDIRAIFNAPNRAEAERLLRLTAERYQENAPKLAEWLEGNIPEGLTVFNLREAHRRRLRTSNMLERLNREIKRRTRVASLFPNEASALRLVSAILAETSDDWEAGRIYLSMEPA